MRQKFRDLAIIALAAVCFIPVAGAEDAHPSAEELINRLTPMPAPVLRGIRPVTPGKESGGAVVTQAATTPSIDLEVHFKFGSAELTDDARKLLDQLGAALMDERLKRYRFRLVGHTDAVGSDEYNKALSEERAQAVRDYLAAKFRVDPARLESVGMGKSELRDPLNPTSEVNRRVQVMNVGTLPQ